MFKRLLLAAVFSATTAGAVSAAPITGSFSLTSFSGTYVGGTAATATGIDFGTTFGGSGNGYGTNGTGLVGNTTGSFAGLAGTTASIADIALAAFANPYTTNPFISFGTNSPLMLNFTNASYTRSTLGTSITVTGAATFTDGVAADTSTGMFSLATSSQNGMSNDVNFTFTSNASVTNVPEPTSFALMIVPMALAGMLVMRRRNSSEF